MEQDEFVQKRPFAYHVTPLANLSLIRRDFVLFSAKALIVEAEGAYVPGPPRTERRSLRAADGSVRVLRDQQPLLKKGQIRLEPGFTIEALVELIDSHVLFWPGLDEGLSTSSKYADEEQATLRVPMGDLFKSNPLPLFCRVNSGGGRASGGLGSLRGPRLFVGPGAFRDGVSSVKEVAFKNRAVLPPSTEVAQGRDRRFVPLVKDR